MLAATYPDRAVTTFVRRLHAGERQRERELASARGERVEVPLERLPAAGHPGVGDLPVRRVAGGEDVQLVGQHEAALVGEDVARDDLHHGPASRGEVVGGGQTFVRTGRSRRGRTA
ncbi:hypothetical protein BAY59_15685 [Prauserella coralliicola]|nr:hypothetical protein BAY59_15685 [Prauserella coralliicola]